MNKGQNLKVYYLLTFIISLYFYTQMPEKIASHWNVKGEVNGYMSKFF